MEDRIIELEKKVAFLDLRVEELNEVIFDQTKQINELKSRLNNLNDQIQSGEMVRKIEDEEPPPHY